MPGSNRGIPWLSGVAGRLGCSPSSRLSMGAERVIAIDHFPRRLELAARFGAQTINYEQTKTYDALMEMMGGIGPDACIDAVGLEAHGVFADNVWDQIKISTFLGTDRTHSIRQAILACRKGGRVSMPAVYGGFIDKFPLGAFMEKGLTLKTGQTHVQHYMPALLNAIMEDKIDTTSSSATACRWKKRRRDIACSTIIRMK